MGTRLNGGNGRLADLIPRNARDVYLIVVGGLITNTVWLLLLEWWGWL